jgi:hypothetical protein
MSSKTKAGLVPDHVQDPREEVRPFTKRTLSTRKRLLNGIEVKDSRKPRGHYGKVGF